MFYLETSALRRVAAFLGSSPRTDSTFTSAFALYEILSGMTPADYSERRAVLCAAQSANLTIDWALPTQVTLDAFGVTHQKDDSSRELEGLCRIVRENSSYNVACEASCSISKRWNLSAIVEARRAVIDSFLGEFADR
jgi:hypothetical protein